MMPSWFPLTVDVDLDTLGSEPLRYMRLAYALLSPKLPALCFKSGRGYHVVIFSPGSPLERLMLGDDIGRTNYDRARPIELAGVTFEAKSYVDGERYIERYVPCEDVYNDIISRLSKVPQEIGVPIG